MVTVLAMDRVLLVAVTTQIYGAASMVLTAQAEDNARDMHIVKEGCSCLKCVVKRAHPEFRNVAVGSGCVFFGFLFESSSRCQEGADGVAKTLQGVFAAMGLDSVVTPLASKGDGWVEEDDDLG